MPVGCKHTLHRRDLFDNVDKDEVVLNSCPGRWDRILQPRETQVRGVHLHQWIFTSFDNLQKKIPWSAPLRCNHWQPSATLVPTRRSCCPPKTLPPPPTGSSRSTMMAPPLGLRGSLILLLSGTVVAKAPPVVLPDQPGGIHEDQVLRLRFSYFFCTCTLVLRLRKAPFFRPDIG